MIDVLERTRRAKIPVYIIFSPYMFATQEFKPPFLRVYTLGANGDYTHVDYRVLAVDEDETIYPENIVDLGEKIPFRVGVQKSTDNIYGIGPCYHLAIFKKDEDIIFKTAEEMIEVRAGEAEVRAGEAEVRAGEAEVRAREAEVRARGAEVRADEIEEILRRYREKYGSL
ncbi:MAG: hypothetical protein ACTSUE_06680 [Promethearchaeota archaeon]